jgi:NADPH:quinone reductase-like Zn-dependent oxidoreductase
VARLLGARRIIATGRDDGALQEVLALGAVINTAVPDKVLTRACAQAAGDSYDVALDFLWGRPTELLLRALVPDQLSLTKPTRLVQVGRVSRSRDHARGREPTDIGSGILWRRKGLNGATMMDAYQQVVQWAINSSLTFDIDRVPLSAIETAWQRNDLSGRRLVVMPRREVFEVRPKPISAVASRSCRGMASLPSR